ncbi:hypothetical protein Bca101_079004 [Brassica carinata]
MEDAFDGPNHGVLMEGINVIGGARIDLEGGSYLIRRPLRFPSAGAEPNCGFILGLYRYCRGKPGSATSFGNVFLGRCIYFDIVGNMFSGPGNGVQIVQLDQTSKAFENVDQVVIDRNSVNGMAIRSTVAKGSVDGNGTSWTVDFNPVLLFPNLISQVQCTLVEREGGGFLVHAVSRRDMTKLLEIQEKIQERLAVTPSLPPLSSPSSPFPKMVGRVIYPISYGADPSGGQDSSDAILEALTDAFRLQTELNMLPRVADLGGVVIDLQGGSYKIGKPLRFPSSGGGNLLVKGGTFRASEVFPGDRHLVELVTSMKMSLEDTFSDQKDQNSGIFFEDVTFKDVLFDSSFRGGGILVINSARIRITDCYFLHFTTQGIKVQGGHETYISNTFLGQHSTVGGDKQERQFSGTGIDISSTDNAITDVVIFSAGIGILLNGQANMVTGVHCYNKATWFGGIGILVKSHLTRIDNCYLDYTGIVIEDPVHVHVTNALFLGDASIVLRSVHGRINGVNIVNNMFSGDPKHNFPMVKLEGEFHEVDQVVIDQNNVEGMVMKSTTGRSKVSGNGTRWVADFSSVLVFPNRVDHYQHSFFAQSGQIPASAVTNVSNNVVVVETDRAVTGTVSVIVYQ